MPKTRFEAELIEGHKGVTAVIVPFNPETAWSRKPVRLDSRRDGWLVAGTANGVRFDGYIGYRWGRFFIIIEPELREAANASVGDTITMVVAPTATRRALVRARADAKDHAAQKKARRGRGAPIAHTRKVRRTRVAECPSRGSILEMA